MRARAKPEAKAEIKDTEDGVVIEVRQTRIFWDIAFLLFWLCGWLAGELIVTWTLIAGTDQYGEPLSWILKVSLIAWLIFWTWAGIQTIREVVNMIWGQDIVTITRASSQ
jgi:hypothetical protein